MIPVPPAAVPPIAMPRPRRAALPLGALAALLLLGACQTPAEAPGQPSLETRLRLSEAVDTARGEGAQATLATLRAAAAAEPRNILLQERLAGAAEREGAPAEAAQAMRRAIAAGGPTLARQMALGRAELLAGQGQAAIDAYAIARRLSPESPAAAGALATAFDIARDHAAARQHHEAALRQAPSDWTLRSNYGLSLVMAGRPEEAVRILGDAAHVADAPRRARHNLALALAALGRRAEVASLLRADGVAEARGAMPEDFEAFAAWLRSLPPQGG